MDDIKVTQTYIDEVKHEEIKAYNIMVRDEDTAKTQQKHLDICLKYRDEHIADLKNTKASGLSVVHVRECRLLVQHLDSVMEVKQYKVDISLEKKRQSEKVWRKIKENYENLKKELDQHGVEAREREINS